jgi:hypothetical protein
VNIPVKGATNIYDVVRIQNAQIISDLLNHVNRMIQFYAPIFITGSPHANHRHISRANVIASCPKPTGINAILDEVFLTKSDYGAPSTIDYLDLQWVDFNYCNVMPIICQTGRRNTSNVSHSESANFHLSHFLIINQKINHDGAS